MSYCVNCGVELGASERCCPLCGVEVINPAAPFDENAERPYPKRAEKIRHREVRIVTAQVLSLLLTVPLLSVLITDLIQDGRLTWSLIPTASIVFVFLIAVFPCLFKRPPIWLFMIFGTVETALTALGGKQQECCCEILRAVDGVNYNSAINTAAINANTTAQTQKILDAIMGNRMADMQSQINQLQLQNSLAGVLRFPSSWTYAGGVFPPVQTAA